MTRTSSSRILRALIQAIRANAGLYADLTGGIHQGPSPEPLGGRTVAIMNLVTAVNEDLWDDSRMIVALVDITVWSVNSVEADNLDESILQTLDGVSLTVDGQTSLICRRVGDYKSTDDDEEGQKLYGVGGSYEVWTDQSA